MDRNNFFGGHSTFEELAQQSRSNDASQRWLAAIGFSQYKTIESARILWLLSKDADTVTQDAAVVALREFDQEVLRQLEMENSAGQQHNFAPGIWKYQNIGPLTKDSEGVFHETVKSILSVEGPTTGARLQRLLGLASGQTRSLTQNRVQRLVEGLIFAHEIARVDIHFDSPDLTVWIFNLPGQPDYCVRKRNERLLTEIPVNEARAVLAEDRQYKRRPNNRELAFKILTEHYEIAPNEFFIVGEALEHQWQGLFG